MSSPSPESLCKKGSLVCDLCEDYLIRRSWSGHGEAERSYESSESEGTHSRRYIHEDEGLGYMRARYLPADDLLTSVQNGCFGCTILARTIATTCNHWKSIRTIALRLSHFAVNLSVTRELTQGEDFVVGSKEVVHDQFHLSTTKVTPWTAIPVTLEADRYLSPLRFSILRIKNWMTECRLAHYGCKDSNSLCQSLLPTRLIDVGDHSNEPRLYLSKGEHGRYVALSHCWGVKSEQIKRLVTTSSNLYTHFTAIPLVQLPQTFYDAVCITRGLGMKYLWIDSLCIIQDSPADWAIEASRMGQVYANATVTLAGDCAPHPDWGLLESVSSALINPLEAKIFHQHDHRGISHRILVWNGHRGLARHRMQDCHASDTHSVLDDRAWVLQERVLSKRIVHFGSGEMVWECRQNYECECGSWETRPSPKYHFEAVRNRYAPEGRRWFSLIEEFTACKITYPTDRLPAISGLASAMVFIKSSDYLAGLWRGSLQYGLLWINYANRLDTELTSMEAQNLRMSKNYAPSWSWASVYAPVSYELKDNYEIQFNWKILDAICLSSSPNPYGPVSGGKLYVKAYIIPTTNAELAATALDNGIEIHSHKDRLWIDSGYSSEEWLGRECRLSYLIIGYHSPDQLPFAFVLKQLKSVHNGEFVRIGIVRLNSWSRKKVRELGTRQTVTIL